MLSECDVISPQIKSNLLWMYLKWTDWNLWFEKCDKIKRTNEIWKQLNASHKIHFRLKAFEAQFFWFVLYMLKKNNERKKRLRNFHLWAVFSSFFYKSKWKFRQMIFFSLPFCNIPFRAERMAIIAQHNAFLLCTFFLLSKERKFKIC